MLIHCKDTILVCLQLHTFQGCFCPQTFFENTGLKSLLWNSVSCLHSNQDIRQGCFVLCAQLVVPVVFGAVQEILFAPFVGSSFWQIYSKHYYDVIMTTMASQVTSPMVVYSTVYSDADQRKHQSSASLAFVWGIHWDRWIPRTNGQLRGKCFHLMTSSWEVGL